MPGLHRASYSNAQPYHALFRAQKQYLEINLKMRKVYLLVYLFLRFQSLEDFIWDFRVLILTKLSRLNVCVKLGIAVVGMNSSLP